MTKEFSMHHLDIKAAVIYAGALFLGDLNAALQAAGLLANLAYIVYQIRVFRRNNDKPNNDK